MKIVRPYEKGLKLCHLKYGDVFSFINDDSQTSNDYFLLTVQNGYTPEQHDTDYKIMKKHVKIVNLETGVITDIFSPSARVIKHRVYLFHEKD